MKDESWSLSEAKAKLSEVVRCARAEGPQRVTKNGRPAVVVVSDAEWQVVSRRRKSFVEALFDPAARVLTDEEVDTLFARDPDVGRPVEF